MGLISVLTHCFAKEDPSMYFSDNQLKMAEVIQRGDTASVLELAESTELNKPGKQDMTLLFYALQNAFGEKTQQLKILSELVQHGADPLQRVPDMGSVAGVAAKLSGPLYMKALLDGGMSPDSLVMSTPVIFYAADDDTISTLDLLIGRGADVNKRDSLGATVIMHALDSLQLDTVSWLLDHGADPTLTETNSGWTFSRQLAAMQKRIGGKDNTDRKLHEIIVKAVSKGMEWPAPE